MSFIHPALDIRFVIPHSDFAPSAATTPKKPSGASVVDPGPVSRQPLLPMSDQSNPKPARKLNPALSKPVQPDEILAKVVGSTPLSRGELTKKLWEYIKKNGLQDQTKKTNINADEALKAVFGGKSQVTMFEMTKLVSQHVK
jgi:chromatin remodeling complex protein RSC6